MATYNIYNQVQFLTSFICDSCDSCDSSTSSSDCKNDLENAAAFIIISEETKKRSKWVHKTNTKREELGEFNRLVQELSEVSNRFHMYFRMYKEFEYLHELIKDDIHKQNTQFRKAIPSRKRLGVFLRYVFKSITK